MPSPSVDHAVEAGERSRRGPRGRAPCRALHDRVDGVRTTRAELPGGQPGAALGHARRPGAAGTACRRWRRRRSRSASCSGVTSTSPCPTARLVLSPRRHALVVDVAAVLVQLDPVTRGPGRARPGRREPDAASGSPKPYVPRRVLDPVADRVRRRDVVASRRPPRSPVVVRSRTRCRRCRSTTSLDTVSARGRSTMPSAALARVAPLLVVAELEAPVVVVTSRRARAECPLFSIAMRRDRS